MPNKKPSKSTYFAKKARDEERHRMKRIREILAAARVTSTAVVKYPVGVVESQSTRDEE